MTETPAADAGVSGSSGRPRLRRGRLTSSARGGELRRHPAVLRLCRALPDRSDADRGDRRIHESKKARLTLDNCRGCSLTRRSSGIRASRSSWPSATAILGAVLGGAARLGGRPGDPNGRLRQVVVAASGVLAQFGGVMLAFAFLATFGFNGLVTLFFKNVLTVDRPRRLDLALRDDRARRRLHLLPDPADGDRVPARRSTACARSGRTRRPASAAQLVVLAARRRADPRAELPRGPAAAVHQRLLGLRDGRRAGQPGQPDRHAPDRRGMSRARSSSARRTWARPSRSG